jgi:hypothetical protein
VKVPCSRPFGHHWRCQHTASRNWIRHHTAAWLAYTVSSTTHTMGRPKIRGLGKPNYISLINCISNTIPMRESTQISDLA